MAPTESLFQTNTKSLPLAKGMLLFAGLLMLLFQAKAFWSRGELPMSEVNLGPGIVAIALIVIAAFLMRGKCHSRLSDDGRTLSGRSAAGKVYELPMDMVAVVEMEGRRLILRGQSGKHLLADGICDNPLFPGLLWLRVHYPETPPEVWQAMAAHAPDSWRCLRQFLDEEGKVAFFDEGILIDIGGRPHYMPTSDTMPALHTQRGEKLQGGLLPRLRAMMHFEPDPGLLPSAAFLAALCADPAREELLALAEAYVLDRGGCALTLDAEDGSYTGEAASWRVRVETGED